MLSGFFNIIILLGALQGFIISSLLFFSKKDGTANKLLAVFIFFIALACLNLYLANQNWATSGSIMPLITAVVPMVIIMPLGPLLYFYAKAVLDPALKLTKKHRRHFATVIIDLVPYLTAIFFIIGVLSHIIPNRAYNVGLFIDNYNVYSDIPRWISLTVYLIISVRYITNFRITAEASNYPYQLKWLKQLTTALIIFQSIWLLYLVPYVMPAYGDKLLDTVNWYPIYLPMSFLIYWLGIKGYLVMKEQPGNIKRSTNSLPADVSEATITALKKAMDLDNLFLNPELSLSLLSHHTGIAQKTISAVLNQHLNTSFNEFVNGYRIDAFKQKLCTDDVKHLTIAGIAAECGFNSQATFQRTFRQLTGLSPSEFKLQALQNA